MSLTLYIINPTVAVVGAACSLSNVDRHLLGGQTMNLLFWWRATSKDFSYMDCADEMLLFEVRDMLESARSHIRWAVVKITGWWVAWLLPWYLLSFWAPDAFPQWFEPVVREK